MALVGTCSCDFVIFIKLFCYTICFVFSSLYFVSEEVCVYKCLMLIVSVRNFDISMEQESWNFAEISNIIY